MRVVIAVVCMAVIGAVAVVLVAVQALINLAPLLVAGLVVVGAARLGARARRARPPRRAALPAETPLAPPILPPPGGWVLVPVWVPPAGCPPRRPVVDAEVIRQDEGRG